MSNQKITYTLDFHANISDVQGQLDRVRQSLTNIAAMPFNVGTKMSAEIKQASQAAMDLQKHMQFALNPQTGAFDMSRFTLSMKNSGQTVQQLGRSLMAIGPEGKKAFLEVANAVTNAQKPMVRMNAMFDKLWGTMANTLRWQISSAVLTGFTSSLSEAVNFAKDLNTALNDIRIVSGDSAEDMEKFAKQANKMAKELRASTVDIAKGTLIYRQQGDTAEQAARKAEITTKAANITTESNAQEMSEHLTAIWNSYQVGSHELELFVDKLAYVGATTATSMEEIATSMTKVAATANSVGVSYDQLLGVIATVSSATRISAESVGTSFKTIFARMGDLKLEGSIDEDGVTTTLGDVSSQLKKVGVDVLDANGNLKDMGLVIENLGEKWQTMDRNTKTAIAEAVAGKRQYTQLFALFDNWDKYKNSVQGAAEAQGTLNEQNKIYAESWEGASQRVKAAIEGITMDFMDDDAIVDAINAFGGFVEILDKVIESVGGFQTVLSLFMSFFISKFHTQISNGLLSLGTNFQALFGFGQKSAQQTTTGLQRMLNDMRKDPKTSSVEKEELNVMSKKLRFYQRYGEEISKLDEGSKRLVEEQLKELENNRQIITEKEVKKAKEEEILAIQKLQTAEQEKQNIVNQAIKSKGVHNKIKSQSDLDAAMSGNGLNAYEILFARAMPKSGKGGIKSFQKFLNQVDPKVMDLTQTSIQGVRTAMQGMNLDANEQRQIMEALSQAIFGSKNGLEQYEAAENDVRQKTDEVTVATEKSNNAHRAAKKGTKEYGRGLGKLGKYLNDCKKEQIDTTDKITYGAQAAMQASMAWSSMNSIIEAFTKIGSEDFEFDNFLQTLLGSIPMVIFGINGMTTALKAMGVAEKTSLILTMGSVILPIILKIGSAIQKNWFPSAKQILDNSKELNEQFEKEKSELEEINKNLKEKQNLLQNSSDLTDKEYATLQNEITVLENKKQLLEQIHEATATAKEITSMSAAEALIDSGYDVSKSGKIFFNENGKVDFSGWSSDIKGDGGFVLNGKSFNKAIENLQQDLNISNPESYIAQVREVQKNLDPASQLYKNLDQEVNNKIQALKEATIYEQAAAAYRKDFPQYKHSGPISAETLDIMGYTDKATKQYEAERNRTKAIEDYVKAEEKRINAVQNTINALDDLSDEFDATNAAIKEFNKDGKVSYSTLSKIKEAFGNQEGVDEFITQMANGSLTIDQMKQKLGEFISVKLEEKMQSDENFASNEALIRSYLEEQGVVNAAEVAHKMYEKQMIKTKIAEMDAKDATALLTDDVETLAKKLGVTKEAAKEAVAQIKLLAWQKLDLTSQILNAKLLAEQLLSIGSSAFGAIAALQALARVQQSFEWDDKSKTWVFKSSPENVISTETYVDGSGREHKTQTVDYSKEYDTIFAKAVLMNPGMTIEEVRQKYGFKSSGKQYAKDVAKYGTKGVSVFADPSGANQFMQDYGTYESAEAYEKFMENFGSSLDIDPSGTTDGGSSSKEPYNWFEDWRANQAKYPAAYRDNHQVLQDMIDAIDTENEGYDEVNGLILQQISNQAGLRTSIEEVNATREQLIKELAEGLGLTVEQAKDMLRVDDEGNISFTTSYEAVYNSLLGNEEGLNKFTTGLDRIKTLTKDILDGTKEIEESFKTEAELSKKHYDNQLAGHDQNIEKYKYENELMEKRGRINWGYHRDNLQNIAAELQAKLAIAKAEGDILAIREIELAIAENYSDIVQSVTDEFDEQMEIANAIADELKYRIEEEKKITEDAITRNNALISLYDTQTSALKTIRDTKKAINDELRNSMINEKWLSEAERDRIFNTEDYLKISSKLTQMEQEARLAHEQYAAQIASLNEDELYLAESITAEYERQTAARERELGILQEEINLIKKRQALTEALSEKNVRVFQGGRWTYMANRQSVQSAAQELADSEYNLGQKRIENEEALHKEEMEAYSRYLENINNARDEEIKMIEEKIEKAERAYKLWNSKVDLTSASLDKLDNAINNAITGLNNNNQYRGTNRNSNSNNSSAGGNNTPGFISDSRAEQLTILQAKIEYANAEARGDQAGMDAAHAKAEDVRNNSQYSWVKGSDSQSASEMASNLGGSLTYTVDKNTGDVTVGFKEKSHNARGTFSSIGGWSEVNEEGIELYGTKDGQFIELNPGEKIFNNEQFKYLYNISKGKTGADYSSKPSNITTVGTMNLTLPNVHDAESFAKGLKNLNEYLKNNNY